MRNIWLGGTVCACCIVVGWWWRRRYKKRCDVMRDFVSLVVWAEEQIGYRLTPLPALFAQYAALHPESVVAQACVDYPTFGPLPCLPSARWREMQDLLSSLGRSDAVGQDKQLHHCKAQALQWQQVAEEEAKEKGALYAKLWAIGGVGLMIWMM